MALIEIKQFDIIKLTTTKHIRYLSAPTGVVPDPHGLWNVVGNLGTDLLVSKGGVLCRVPSADVILIGKSPTEKILEILNGQKGRREDTKVPEVQQQSRSDEGN